MIGWWGVFLEVTKILCLSCSNQKIKIIIFATSPQDVFDEVISIKQQQAKAEAKAKRE